MKKLKEAGALILGKSNMAEWAFSPYTSAGSAFGVVRNPYSLDRVTAGSSGGSAAGASPLCGTPWPSSARLLLLIPRLHLHRYTVVSLALSVPLLVSGGFMWRLGDLCAVGWAPHGPFAPPAGLWGLEGRLQGAQPFDLALLFSLIFQVVSGDSKGGCGVVTDSSGV